MTGGLHRSPSGLHTRTAPVGTSTGTLEVLVGGMPVGTVYPVYLPGRLHTAGAPVAWCAYREGQYAGHHRSRTAAVRVVAA